MIPIYKPYMPDNILGELNTILYSGQLGFGKYGIKFESQLREFIGSEFVLSINSYNTALQIVLSTLGLNYGDEIIASPVSCLASNQPFATKGLKVIWCDVNPNNGTLCPIDLENKITKNTKAIFHNHFCGYLGEIDQVNLIGKKYGIPIIDDGIEAFGSKYKGKRLGNVGTDITIFSFQTVRLPNTIDGGAVVFKDKKMFEKAILIRDYGIDRSRFRMDDGEINPLYDIDLEGYAGLMSELNSYIGTRQMLHIDRLLTTQKINSKNWQPTLAKIEGVSSLNIINETEPNYWVLGLLSKNKKKTIEYFKSNGYYASGVHINNNIYSIFKNKSPLSGVSEFIEKFVAIPCGWWVKNTNI